MSDFFPVDFFPPDYFGLNLPGQAMQILAPDDIATLKTELAKSQYQGLSDLDALNALYTPTSVPNPAPQGQVPKPFGPDDILGSVSFSSLGKIRTETTLPLSELNRSIMAQDRVTVAKASQLYLVWGDITQAEHDAIAAVLAATIADPAWPATLAIGPSPADTLFGVGKVWPQPGGGTSGIQVGDVTLARSS